MCSFGIGTNVSDALLRDLARETGGAVEFIHPGERIGIVGATAGAVAGVLQTKGRGPNVPLAFLPAVPFARSARRAAPRGSRRR